MIISFLEAPSSNFRNLKKKRFKSNASENTIILFSYTPQTVTVHVSSILSKQGNERIPILYYSGLKITSLHNVAVIFLNSKNIIPKPWLSGAERYCAASRHLFNHNIIICSYLIYYTGKKNESCVTQ